MWKWVEMLITKFVMRMLTSIKDSNPAGLTYKWTRSDFFEEQMANLTLLVS